jgi:protoheme IX farnesyltransferase
MSIGVLEGASPRVGGLRDWYELTKPRITLMVVITAAAGFLLAAGSLALPWWLLVNTLVGTGLVSAGASVLNQVMEVEADAKMRRTANRALPTGRISADGALVFGVLLATGGMVQLALAVNLLTALLAALTVAGYLFVYTPLKRIDPISTIVGAVPGAIPPLMGWTALRDAVEPGGLALFGLLFLWQLPHFLAIAWMYRADYERGGFKLLTGVDPDGRRTGQQALLWCAALVPVSLMPSGLGLTGVAYFIGALAAGLLYLAASYRFARERNTATARRLLLVSVFYLPVVLAVMMVDRALG